MHTYVWVLTAVVHFILIKSCFLLFFSNTMVKIIEDVAWVQMTKLCFPLTCDLAGFSFLFSVAMALAFTGRNLHDQLIDRYYSYLSNSIPVTRNLTPFSP